MKKRVYKYPLRVVEEQYVPLDDHNGSAQLLTVQVQNNAPQLWAVVDVDRMTDAGRTLILCRGTGHDFTGDEREYLGTVQMAGGNLVWHFFRGQQ